MPIKRHEIFAFPTALKTHTKTRMSDVRERELLGSLREQRLQRNRVAFVLSTRVHMCVYVHTTTHLGTDERKQQQTIAPLLALFPLQIDYLHTVG